MLILPGTATLLVPAWILSGSASGASHWIRIALSVPGIAFVVAGLFLMTKTIALFSGVGEGTLAPWDPPRKLVVQGVYRYLRNPMITGVISVLLGEAALSASVAMLEWFLVFAVINFIYMPLLEEPLLVQRFGADYEEYRRNVPRWIPRRTPWNQPPPQANSEPKRRTRQ